MSKATVLLVCDVPVDLLQRLLQHMRDFDTANAGCRFKVSVVAKSLSTSDMRAILRDLKPPFPHMGEVPANIEDDE